MMSRSKDRSTDGKRKSPLRQLARLISFAMLISAIGQELLKPAEERTWQGRVWRVVPYDFRPPTWARLRDTLWAPENPQIFTPRVFGVGWSVNLGRVYAVLTSIIRPDAPAE
jgi:Family of unknown function (DUF5808)